MKRRSFLKLLGISAAVPGTLFAASKPTDVAISLQDFKERILDPAMREMVSGIDCEIERMGMVYGHKAINPFYDNSDQWSLEERASFAGNKPLKFNKIGLDSNG